MTYKRFSRIQNGRSYTITNYVPNTKDSLRISKEKMVVFNYVEKLG